MLYWPAGRVTPPEWSLCRTVKLMPLHDALELAKALAANVLAPARRSAIDTVAAIGLRLRCLIGRV
jgi:hypothetical protein